MLKLGKVIVPEVDIVSLSLEEFSLTELKWLESFEATFSLERKSFARGGFRDGYLGKAISGVTKGRYVLRDTERKRSKKSKIWNEGSAHKESGANECTGP